MKRSVILSAALLALWLAGQARAGFTIYTSRADYDAATTGNTVIDFSGLAPANGSTFFGGPGSLTVGAVTFQSSHFMFVQNDGISSRLTFQQGSPTNALDVTLPAGISAVGFDYFAGTVLTLTLPSGEAFDLPIVDFPNFDFIGFTTDAPFGSFHLESVGGGDLKNFTFGQIAGTVPEPNSLTLLGLGVLAMVGFARDRS